MPNHRLGKIARLDEIAATRGNIGCACAFGQRCLDRRFHRRRCLTLDRRENFERLHLDARAQAEMQDRLDALVAKTEPDYLRRYPDSAFDRAQLRASSGLRANTLRKAEAAPIGSPAWNFAAPSIASMRMSSGFRAASRATTAAICSDSSVSVLCAHCSTRVA